MTWGHLLIGGVAFFLVLAVGSVLAFAAIEFTVGFTQDLWKLWRKS